MLKKEDDRACILIVDDTKDHLDLLHRILKKEYRVLCTQDGKEALEVLKPEKPNLILMDIMMPELDGMETLKIIKQDASIRHIPVIMLSARGDISSRVKCLEIGAVDFICKPFDAREVRARVAAQIRQFDDQYYANPLTGLPGNVVIEHEINRWIEQGKIFAFCYIDMDNFKAYNDYYGFDAGDKLILFLKTILLEAKHQVGNTYDFVGHVGGDDFVYITDFKKVDRLCKYIIKQFDQQVEEYYHPDDRKKGYIETLNRQRKIERYPFISLSIAVSTNNYRPIKDHREVSKVISEVKIKLKSTEGSNYEIDRRKTGD